MLANNYVKGNGGAIYVYDSTGKIELNANDILFSNNSATDSGAVFFTNSNRQSINYCKLTGMDNFANNTYNGASFYTGNGTITLNDKLINNSEFGRYYQYLEFSLIVNGLTMYYKDGSKFTVELKNGTTPLVGKTVKIVLNGQTYERVTDSEGIASMNINLDIGSYPVTATYEGLTSDATINVKSTISGDNITKIYKNDTQYYAKFLDKKGNPLTNTDVQFNINGVFYTRTTDNNGIARMNINLVPNTYILTATNLLMGKCTLIQSLFYLVLVVMILLKFIRMVHSIMLLFIKEMVVF